MLTSCITFELLIDPPIPSSKGMEEQPEQYAAKEQHSINLNNGMYLYIMSTFSVPVVPVYRVCWKTINEVLIYGLREWNRFFGRLKGYHLALNATHSTP